MSYYQCAKHYFSMEKSSCFHMSSTLEMCFFPSCNVELYCTEVYILEWTESYEYKYLCNAHIFTFGIICGSVKADRVVSYIFFTHCMAIEFTIHNSIQFNFRKICVQWHFLEHHITTLFCALCCKVKTGYWCETFENSMNSILWILWTMKTTWCFDYNVGFRAYSDRDY